MIIDGYGLDSEKLTLLARTPSIKIRLDPAQIKCVDQSRRMLEEAVSEGRVIYGVNTSMGGFVKWLVPTSKANELQNNLIASVASNVGRYFDDEITRAAMITRSNSLIRGHSAIQVKHLETYVDIINKGVVPCVPEKGSLGASGDLGPLAAIALVCTGKWKARYKGEVLPANEALDKAGIEPMHLSYKEGLALINGTSYMTGLASLVLEDATALLDTYHIISCLSFEALQARKKPFDPSVHIVKNHAGQIEVANFIMSLLSDSQLVIDDDEVECLLKDSLNDQVHEGQAPIEDAYSIRCSPQILGPLRDSTAYVGRIIEEELNSSNDNPLVMPESGKILHNGNFHGQYISMAMDNLAISLTTLCNLSDRRIDRLLDSSNSNGLPAFLCNENPGLRLGLMGGQFTSTSLTAENRSLCVPISIQTLTSTADFQDHVSFGLVAARRAREILRNAHIILGFELICACQGVDIRGTNRLSSATSAVYKVVRNEIPYLDHDEPMTDLIEKAAEILSSGKLIAAVEDVAGPLEELYRSTYMKSADKELEPVPT